MKEGLDIFEQNGIFLIILNKSCTLLTPLIPNLKYLPEPVDTASIFYLTDNSREILSPIKTFCQVNHLAVSFWQIAGHNDFIRERLLRG